MDNTTMTIVDALTALRTEADIIDAEYRESALTIRACARVLEAIFADLNGSPHIKEEFALASPDGKGSIPLQVGIESSDRHCRRVIFRPVWSMHDVPVGEVTMHSGIPHLNLAHIEWRDGMKLYLHPPIAAGISAAKEGQS